MVAIVSGNGLGLFNSSLGLLGAGGATGQATLGRGGEGVYLNAATGNLILQRQDELLIGPGQDIGLVRTYNSQGQMTDDNGDNWRLGVHNRIGVLSGAIGAAGSSIRRTGSDGVELVYSYDTALGRYVNKDGAGSFDYLDYNSAAGTWTWTDGNSRVTEIYDWLSGSGKLLAVRELGSSNGLTYTYNGNLLASITDEAGEKVTFDYSGSNLTAIHTSDASGKVSTRVRYTYDASNRLTSVTVDLSPEDNSITDGNVYVTSYTYDGASKRVASITQTDGSHVEFTYQTLSDGSVRVSQIRQSVDGATRTTNISYDLAAGKTSVTDPLNNVTQYTYDAQGRLTNLKQAAVGDGLTNNGVSYAYDADGNVISQTDARGNTVSYTYDASGNLLLQRDAAGNTVVRTYGASNELLTETRYLVADPDGAGSAQPSAPVTTRYVYDSLLRQRFVISAAGRVSEYRYGSGRLVTSTLSYASTAYTAESASYDALVGWVASSAVDKTRSILTSYVRDSRGQVSSSTVYSKVASDGSGLADGTESVTRYVYDQAGQLLLTIAPKGKSTVYTYDGLGRLLSTTDALGNLTLNQYDDASNQTRTTLANGLVTVSAYNKAGELITVSQSDSSKALGATTYQYDADGQLRMTQDPLGLRHFYFYDAAGRKVAEVDANGSLTEYRYNQNNQLAQTIARYNAVAADKLATLVDANGKVTSATLASIMPAASSSGDVTSWNFYDQAGRLAKTRDPKGMVTEYKYDGASRLLAQSIYATLATGSVTVNTLYTDAVISQTSTSDRTTRYFYDDDGLALGKLDAGSYLTENEYNAAGQLVHTIAYANGSNSSYVASGTLAQLRPAANGSDIHQWLLYDTQGRLVAQVDGEGYLTESQYDLNGNLVKKIRYANRALLVPTAITAATKLENLLPADRSGQTTSWTYTDLNQIQTQTDPEGTVLQYSYNKVGQVTRSDRAYGTNEVRSQQVRYDVQGRVVAELSAQGSAALAALVSPTSAQIDAVWARYSTRYSYDAAGRRLSATDANGNTTRMYYNADGQLIYTVNALGEVTQSSYNALHQLTQTRLYANRLSAAALAVMTGGDAKTVDAAIAAIADDSRDSTVDLAYDQRGSVVTKTDALKYVTTSSYTTFGELTATLERISDTAQLRTDYWFDRRGMLYRTTLDFYGIAQAIYQNVDAFGRVIQSGRVNYNNTSTSYDRLGRVVKTVDAINATRSSTYDAFDRVATTTDANGKVTRYTYDTSARSMTVTTPEGVSTTTTRNRHGETVLVKDGRGNTTSYQYDANGKLIRSSADTLNIATSNVYDDAGRLLESTDAKGVKTGYAYDAANRILTRTVDTAGLKLVTSYGYDSAGRVLSVTDPAGRITQNVYDKKGQLLSVTVDPAGLKLRTEYSYDGRGNTLTVTEGAGTADARVTQYIYDVLGRRTKEVVDPNGLKQTTLYVYDINNNVVSRTDAVGTAQERKTIYTYDADNRLGYTVDALGRVSVNRYNLDGTLREHVEYANPLTAAGIASIPLGSYWTSSAAVVSALVLDAGRDRTTRYFYDQDERLRFTVDAAGAVTERQYDGNGNVFRLVQYANGFSGTAVAGVLPAVVDAAQGSGSYVIRSAADRITLMNYDALDRLTERTNGAGSTEQNTERWEYDQNGNVVSYTDGRGNTRWSAYDSANRLVREIDAGGYVTARTYYDNGTLKSVTRYKQAVALPGAADKLWAYNAAAPQEKTDPVSGDQRTEYSYDKAGRLETQRLATSDVAGAVTRYTYDALNHVVDTIVADGSAQAVTSRSTYDLLGNVLTVTRAYGTANASSVRYVYDALGNQTDIYVAENSTIAQHTVQEFDRLGRKTKVTAGAGSVASTSTTTVYNTFGDIVKVIDGLNRSGYFYSDALGRVTLQVDPGGAVTSTRYDLLGNVVETIHYGNRVQDAVNENTPPQILSAAGSGVYVVADARIDQRQQAILDVLGRTREIRTWYGAGANDYYSEVYTYNAAGKVLTAQGRNQAVTSYEYDARNQMLREVLPVTSKNANGNPVAVENRYEYDALGNLITKTEAYGLPEQRITKYGYDQLNRQITESGETRIAFDPVARQDVTVTPVITRVYDARGNLIEEKDALGGRTLHYYDTLNREVGRIDANGAYTALSYDAAGNKSAQTLYANLVIAIGGGAIASGVAPVIVQSGGALPASGSYVLADKAQDRSTSYGYDALGRLTSTTVANVQVGVYNRDVAGSAPYQTEVKDIVTRNEYDALGNVVKTIDGNGNVTRMFYNASGQMTGKLDALGYLTVWTRDAFGAVVKETRYATSLAGKVSISDGIQLETLVANASSGASDRITNYARDNLGRVLTQSVENVSYGTLDSNGKLTEGTAAAVTRYVYDGLSNVMTVTDANGAVTALRYDNLGRKTHEERPQYFDVQNILVKPATDYEYDGLNQVTRELIRGTNDSTENDDRITRYFYKNGYLVGQTDPTQARIDYKVDAAGKIVRKTLQGMKDPNGQALTNVTDYWYDKLGREIKHADQATGTTYETRYNAFGDISGKRTNGSGSVWAETTEYDNAGHAWRTNTGDGIVKVYGYDANGNATLKIDNATVDLRTLSLDQIIKLDTSNQTGSVYDARNQLIDTYEPQMNGNYNIISVRQILTDEQGKAYLGGWESAGTNSGASASGGSKTGAAQGAVTVSVPQNISVSVSTSYSYLLDNSVQYGDENWDYGWGHSQPWFVSAEDNLSVTIPSAPYTGNFIVKYWAIGSSSNLEPYFEETREVVFGSTIGPLKFNIPSSGERSIFGIMATRQIGYTISQKISANSNELVELMSYSTNVQPPYDASKVNIVTEVSHSATIGARVMTFSDQDPNATRLVLMTHRVNSSSGWYALDVPRTGSGRFEFDWSGWPREDYLFKYVVMDASGNTLNAETGSFQLNEKLSRPVQTPQPMGGYGAAGSPGTVFQDESGMMNFTELGSDVTSVTIRARPDGSLGAWTEFTLSDYAVIGGQAVKGWFKFDAGARGLGGKLEYVVDELNSANKIVRHTSVTFDPARPGDLFNMSVYTPPEAAATIPAQPSSATKMSIRYRVSNSGAEYSDPSTISVENGRFTWKTGAIFSSYTTNRDYDFVYEFYDEQGVVVNKAHGVITLGATPRVNSVVPDNVPTVMSFAVPTGTVGAAKANVTYALQGSTAASKQVTLSVNSGAFSYDISDLIAPGTSGVIEYTYALLKADGTALLAPNGSQIIVSGTLTLGRSKAAPQLSWSSQSVATTAAVHHSKQYNAFGEVIQETDNNRNVTDLSYNTLGKLVFKQDAQSAVTLTNGFQTSLRPTTTYIYDLNGNLISVRDANGNLNSQLLLAGTTQVITQFNADGGKRQNGYDIFGDLRYTVDEINRRTDYTYDTASRLIRIDRPAHSDGIRAYDSYEYDVAGNRYIHRTSPVAGVVYTDQTYYDSLGRVVKTVTPLGRGSVFRYDWDANIMSLGSEVKGGWRLTTTDATGRSTIDETDVYNRQTKHTDLGGHVFTYKYNYAGWLISQKGTSGQDISYDYFANGYVRTIKDNAARTISAYDYDAAGNRTYESYSRILDNGVVESLQNSTIEYDSQNRVVRINDARADIRYEYDAVGNRRRVWSYYHDGVNGSVQVQDYWYAYDAMNRFTVTMGKLSGSGTRGVSATDGSVGVIAGTSGDGVQVFYNLAGERIETITARDGHREDYEYSREGYLEYTYINNTGSTSKGALAARRTNDLLGRTLQYSEYDNKGAEKYVANKTFDADNRQLSESGTNGTATYYYYGARNSDGSDNLDTIAKNGVGELAKVELLNGTITTKTQTFYDYWDQAKQRDVTVEGIDPRLTSAGIKWKPGLSSYSYDANGHLISAIDSGPDGTKGNADDITYTYISNAQGMILQRQRAQGGVVRPSHMYLYVNGTTVGDIGTDGDQYKDYAQILAQQLTTRDSEYAYWQPISSADFDQNYLPINRDYPAATSSSYVVTTGDTLYSIAARIWGDSSLWYLIADANGLVAASDLKAGQTLVIPNKVANQHNTSATMRPYDAGKRIGDTSPTLPEPPPPPPPQDGGCGGIGKLIVAVVTVVVAAYTGGLLGAALGNLAGQVTSMAMGLQSGINWKSVATSAITSTLLYGLGDVAAGLGVAKDAYPVLNASINAGVANVASQGVSMLTGQQHGFSWTSVAASAISAPLMYRANDELFKKGTALGDWARENSFGGLVATSSVSSVISASTRVAIVGGKVNWTSVATDAFGNALGSSLASTINDSRTAARIEADQMRSGQDEAAIEKSSWASRSSRSPGTSAMLNGFEYAEEAAEPQLVKTAQAGGHFYLPLLIANAAGISNERLGRIIAFSQFPDQIAATDGFTNGTRSIIEGDSYAPAFAGLQTERALHALNGMSMQKNIDFYQTMIAENRDNDAVIGLSLHGLGDSIFHSQEVNGEYVTFEAPLGHGAHGSEPDYISASQARAATAQYIAAFETITGTPFSDEQKASVFNALNTTLNRAAALTAQEVTEPKMLAETYGPDPSARYIDPSERMELNFREVVKASVPNIPGVKLEDLPSPFFRGQITEQSTLTEGHTFFSNLPPEEADALTKQGMNAAALITNRFNSQFGDQTAPRTIQPNDLNDNKVWSLKRAIPWINQLPQKTPTFGI